MEGNDTSFMEGLDAVRSIDITKAEGKNGKHKKW